MYIRFRTQHRMYFETLIDERIAISRNEWAQNGLDRLEVLPFPRLDAFKTNIKTFGSKYEAEKVVFQLLIL